MADHPNARLLKRLYEGDRAALYDAMAPDYVAHVPGNSMVAGDYHGVHGHIDHIERFMTLTGGTMRKQLPGVFLADDHWGLVPSRLLAQRGAATLDLQGFGLWRFEDGRVVEHWGLVSDQAAFDSFFAADTAEVTP